jgi:hypothetical protein
MFQQSWVGVNVVRRDSRAFRPSYHLAYSIPIRWCWTRMKKSFDWGSQTVGDAQPQHPYGAGPPDEESKHTEPIYRTPRTTLRNPHVHKIQCFILNYGNYTLFGATPQFSTDSVGPHVTSPSDGFAIVRCEPMDLKSIIPRSSSQSYPILSLNSILS